MDKLLYVAMTGTTDAIARQAINSHNLANINTYGFRADLAASRSIEIANNGIDSRVPVDTIDRGVDLSPGKVIQTGRDLDIAIQGDGYIATINPDGSESYTRAGNLQLSPDGILTAANGNPVAGNFGPILVSPYESLEIGVDGTISIQPLGDTSGVMAIIDRIKLVNPDNTQLQKNEAGELEMRPRLIKTTTINNDSNDDTPDKTVTYSEIQPTAPADGAIKVLKGALETSNVNVTSSLLTMIELSRNYELQINMMKKAEENDSAMNRLLA